MGLLDSKHKKLLPYGLRLLKGTRCRTGVLIRAVRSFFLFKWVLFLLICGEPVSASLVFPVCRPAATIAPIRNYTIVTIIMKWTCEHAGPDPAQLWQILLEEGRSPDTLILVSNLLMERELRKKWQRDTSGFAPDIRTLTSFVEELAMHSLAEADLPALVPSAEERTLWLEQWLSSHGNPEYRRFAGMTSVTAISNIIADLYREHLRPGMLLEKERTSGSRMTRDGNVLAGLLQEYEQHMTRKKWVDREHLTGKMTQSNDAVMRHKKIIFFLTDVIDPVHKHALGLLGEADLVSIRFADDPAAALPAGNIFVDVFQHPREELEQAVRQILSMMSEDNEYHEQHASVSNYEDVVILTGDLSLYEPMVRSVAGRFGVPLYTSRGSALISNPFIRRMLTYFKLGENDFPIDDVSRVFADNRLVLPDLQGHDENKAPNIRHFSQFCREYNFRTLDEAASGMDRVFDWLLDHIHLEDDEERVEQLRNQERRNREFYSSVLDHLDALRRFYDTPERQTLTAWVEWTRTLLRLQGDLMSREANEAKELLEIILEKLKQAEARLGLGRKMARREFFRVLELRLKETRERPQERPGGILLTEIRQLPEVHDKTVFILGLHEEGFPRQDKPDFLQFRYEKTLKLLTKKDGSEGYIEARKQFQRLLASDKPRYLSRPSLVAQKSVMPSPLWLELLDNRDAQDFRRWPVTAQKWLMSEFEAGRLVSTLTQYDSPAHIIDIEGQVVDGKMTHYKSDHGASFKSSGQRAAWIRIHQKNPASLTEKQPDSYAWQLAVAVQKARQNPNEMGRYDGVLDPETASHWLGQQFDSGAMRMSISRLDTYAGSPHEYFFKYVLRLKPLHEYQDDAESNIKGGLLHQILEEFYSHTAEEGPPVWPEKDPGAATERMGRIRRRLTEAYRHQLGNPQSPFPGILQKNLERVTRWFLEREAGGREDFLTEVDDARPAVFYPESGLRMEHKWSFMMEMAGVPVLFRGMIDRIDVTPDGRCALIYDYKSGKSGTRSYNNILEGNGFQLPVYAMYLRQSGLTQFVAGYYTLPINGKKKDVKCDYAFGSAELIDKGHLLLKNKSGRKKAMLKFKPEEEMDAFMQAFEQLRISWIVEAIRSGRFHASLTGDPAWSDFRHINRYDVRIQQQRRNREVSRRRKKKLKFELDRYYLFEPFWEDADGG